MKKPPPPAGSFEAAERLQLRLGLKATPAQRLLDLQDMIEFNARVEELNPGVRRVARKLPR